MSRLIFTVLMLAVAGFASVAVACWRSGSFSLPFRGHVTREREPGKFHAVVCIHGLLAVVCFALLVMHVRYDFAR